MDSCETMINKVLSEISKKCPEELRLFKISVKQNHNFPRLKMREAQEIIFKRTGRDNRKEPDLEPDDEREICKWAKEKHESDFIFITHYPTKKRPFYTKMFRKKWKSKNY